MRSKTFLSADVCRLLIEPTSPLYYHAGQFINLRRPDGLSRSYSLASVPSEDSHLEVHVRRRLNGTMSNWIFDSLKSGDTLSIQGPLGSCYYLGDRREDPLLLVGTGTGLAPLVGIARDALRSGHRGPVYLYHGASRTTGIYYDGPLRTLAETHSNLKYVPCVSRESAPVGCEIGRADAIAFARHRDLKGWRVFLCGAPPMVYAAKKLAYLLGADIGNIYADAFEARELRGTTRR